jgi:hypothetical protein
MNAATLENVNKSTEFSFDDVIKAYEQAELYTELGFEVTVPKSYDGGATFFIVVSKPE